MDARGWIPIQLIASFNRVKQLTTDVQLVKDVLSLSSLVEVRNDHVRLCGDSWVNFVLPGAAASNVENDSDNVPTILSSDQANQSTDGVEREIEEEEEDDVVFVLGGESASWMPDRSHPSQAFAAGTRNLG